MALIEYDIRYVDSDYRTKGCVYMIEFENDLKLWIGYTLGSSLQSTLQHHIVNAFDEGFPKYDSAFYANIRESKYITVSILHKSYSESELIQNKYKYIKMYDTLYPSGYNSVIGISNRKSVEAMYLKKLLAEDIYFSTFKNFTRKKVSRCRQVAQKDKKTHKLIQIWPSVAEAAKWTGASYSNIAACCRGKLKSTNDCCWEYLEG